MRPPMPQSMPQSMSQPMSQPLPQPVPQQEPDSIERFVLPVLRSKKHEILTQYSTPSFSDYHHLTFRQQPERARVAGSKDKGKRHAINTTIPKSSRLLL